jgi:hypothetical protein
LGASLLGPRRPGPIVSDAAGGCRVPRKATVLAVLARSQRGSQLIARNPPRDGRPMQLGSPMTLFEARANLLPATLTGMEKPLCSIYVGEEQSDCLFAEGAVARFYWNRHKEFYLAAMGRCTMTAGGNAAGSKSLQSRWQRSSKGNGIGTGRARRKGAGSGQTGTEGVAGWRRAVSPSARSEESCDPQINGVSQDAYYGSSFCGWNSALELHLQLPRRI